jgi:hypothetical protein
MPVGTGNGLIILSDIPGKTMTSHRNHVVLLTITLLFSVFAFSDNKPDKPKKLSDEGRKSLIRGLQAEQVFVRKYFPMGRVGLRIENGAVTPSDAEIRQITADNGPAAKPGDRVKISNLIFKKDAIVLELNGGPVKKKKWYDRIQVSGNGGGTTPTNTSDSDPDNLYINARGSYVTLAFKDYVPELTTQQVKDLLNPVFDWKAMSVAEAYSRSLSPQLQAALKEHKILVGMDRELVTSSKGRPPRRHREKDAASGTDYEEWIYGEPPSEVEFVRFNGDRVVRIETMRVDGEKVVRTAKEVDLDSEISTMASKQETKPAPAKNAPTLMRDGETPPEVRQSASTQDKNPRPAGQKRPGDEPNPSPSGVPDASQGTPQPEPSNFPR